MDAKASTDEHFEIVSAVRNHAPDLARRLMVEHIGRAEDRIVKALRAAHF